MHSWQTLPNVHNKCSYLIPYTLPYLTLPYPACPQSHTCSYCTNTAAKLLRQQVAILKPPPEGICRIKLNNVGSIPQRCRKMCATANRNWGKCIAVYKIISWRLQHSFDHCSCLNWKHQFEQVAPVWSGLLEHLILKKGQYNWQHSGVCLWWEKVDQLDCAYASTELD